LGVIVGLHSGTRSELAVMVGIIVLAIADALSDAMGIHVSEEAEMEHTTKEIWQVTLFTFISQLLVALTFIVPITFLELSTAIMASIAWGLFLITVFSFYMAKLQKQSPYRIIAEHVIIAALVVLLAHSFGDLIYEIFKM
jgi:VIT1/CCC1 family predicted Fe2+/Mn2+ transporter